MHDCLGLALRGHESGPKFVEFPRADLKSPAPPGGGPELKAPAADDSPSGGAAAGTAGPLRRAILNKSRGCSAPKWQLGAE
jgi:hypothetical protein